MAKIPFLTKKDSDEVDGQVASELKNNYEEQRFGWERIWHENNFFDDGFHYKVISPDTKRVLEDAGVVNQYNPRRTIPKASRQIRGIINLLLANRPLPVIYPRGILKANYSDPQKMQAAESYSRAIAQRTGQFVLDVWKKQNLINHKLPYVLLLTCKHSVGYLKIWPDHETKQVRVDVRDAFDLYLTGKYDDIQNEPVIIESYSEELYNVKNNPAFADEVKKDLKPDNKYSSSRVKDSYMNTRYGKKKESALTDTVILYEVYVKEFLTKECIAKINKQPDASIVLRGKNIGDVVIRQYIFANNCNEPLMSTYTTLSKYPYVAVQLEPGPLYSTPMLDRFKPMNKSLDNTISKIEKTVMTNAGGRYWTRGEEKPVITNDNAGEWVTSSIKPEVLPSPEVSASSLNFIGLLTSYIEEQGVTTSALAKIPNDVKSGVAIESLKSSEYANLTIALEQLKKAVGEVAEMILEIVDDYYITPQAVYYMNEGKPDYFHIIGARGVEIYKSLKQENLLEDVVVVSKDSVVDIEIESGLGYTIEGRRANAQSVIDTMRAYAAEGYVPPEVVKSVIIEYLKTFQYGNLAEITKSFEMFSQQAQQAQEDGDAKMKLALAQVLQDVGLVGPKAQEQQVTAAKVGTAQALNDIAG